MQQRVKAEGGELAVRMHACGSSALTGRRIADSVMGTYAESRREREFTKLTLQHGCDDLSMKVGLLRWVPRTRRSGGVLRQKYRAIDPEDVVPAQQFLRSVK